MKLSDYESYKDVIYTPYEGCDKRQYGVTTNANSRFIFVRFNFSSCSIACSPEHLEYYTKKKRKEKKVNKVKENKESAPEINAGEEIDIDIKTGV